jgi:hypothetical protein
LNDNNDTGMILDDVDYSSCRTNIYIHTKWSHFIDGLGYNVILLRKNHPPTENRVLLLIGVERKPPRTAPVYDAGANAGSPQEDESKLLLA